MPPPPLSPTQHTINYEQGGGADEGPLPLRCPFRLQSAARSSPLPSGTVAHNVPHSPHPVPTLQQLLTSLELVKQPPPPGSNSTSRLRHKRPARMNPTIISLVFIHWYEVSCVPFRRKKKLHPTSGSFSEDLSRYMMCHPCCWYPGMIVLYRSASFAVAKTFSWCFRGSTCNLWVLRI